jgi:type III restriction enzyme
VLFRECLDAGQIQFRLRGDAGDWIMPGEEWTTAQIGATQLTGAAGGALERSLFLPIYAADLNSAERNVAIYLDDEAAIRWWHRNGVDRNSYGLRGWRRGAVYPDFVFAALRSETGDRIVAVEAKGDQLAGNLDTEYSGALVGSRWCATRRRVFPGPPGVLELFGRRGCISDHSRRENRWAVARRTDAHRTGERP